MRNSEYRPVAAQLQAEDATREADAGEAARQLAVHVAHDFNNVLGVVSGYLQLMEESLHSPERLAAYLEKAQAAIQDGGSLTSKLMAFSRSRRRQ